MDLREKYCDTEVRLQIISYASDYFGQVLIKVDIYLVRNTDGYMYLYLYLLF